MNLSSVITKVRTILPEKLSRKLEDAQIQILVQVVIDDINYTTPKSEYTIDTVPDDWESAILMGFNLFYNICVLQPEYALKDFSYNDNGLSLNIDRQAKLNSILQAMTNIYEQQKWGIKKASAFKNIKGLGYPRFQSQVGQFLRIVFGRSYRQ